MDKLLLQNVSAKERLETEVTIREVTNVNELEQSISQLQEGETKPTDQDIENAAAEYCNGGYLEYKQVTTIVDKVGRAYVNGARDLRDNNIYISPK